MRVTHGTVKRGSDPVALTIGNFDGVHLGHRAMLARVVAKARELKLASGVLTFEPHPREFFSPATAPTRLARLREKLEMIAEAGIERTHVLRFNAALAGMGAERFVDEVLVRGLGTRFLLVGRDFRFGAKRSGDFALLEAAAARRGFALEAMPDVLHRGARVSSSRVREALAAGRLDDAAQLLGRRYTMSGRIAHGAKLGRTLGFPTANVILRRRPPLAGIFAVRAELEETRQAWRGVASVGRRPTVAENGPLLLEVHLFEASGELYGRHLRVTFLEKLRDEKKFDGVQALTVAIRQDAEHARQYFETHG
jgi:riboflavin kinase/FMN adenylyltransferase